VVAGVASLVLAWWIVSVIALAGRGRLAVTIDRELERQYARELTVLREWCIRQVARSGVNWGFEMDEPRFEELVPALFDDPLVLDVVVWHVRGGDRGRYMVKSGSLPAGAWSFLHRETATAGIGVVTPWSADVGRRLEYDRCWVDEAPGRPAIGYTILLAESFVERARDPE
jgi:hypothetical protein